MLTSPPSPFNEQSSTIHQTFLFGHEEILKRFSLSPSSISVEEQQTRCCFCLVPSIPVTFCWWPTNHPKRMRTATDLPRCNKWNPGAGLTATHEPLNISCSTPRGCSRPYMLCWLISQIFFYNSANYDTLWPLGTGQHKVLTEWREPHCNWNATRV